MISDKCHVIAPIFGTMNYNQIMALANKSDHISKANSFVNDKVNAINNTPQVVNKMVETLKLAYQMPVQAVIRKAILTVSVVSIVVIVVRFLLL